MSDAGASSPIRSLVPGDAAGLLGLRRANRTFLEPFEPPRDEAFWTLQGQAAWLAALAASTRDDRARGFAILDGDGSLAGTAVLSNIARGPFRSASIGYWVDGERNGRGLARRAVGAVLERAFGDVGLHRVEAATLVDNVPSQRVLERNGFERIGLARAYLLIDGAWRDHLLHQRIAP